MTERVTVPITENKGYYLYPLEQQRIRVEQYKGDEIVHCEEIHINKMSDELYRAVKLAGRKE